MELKLGWPAFWDKWLVPLRRPWPMMLWAWALMLALEELYMEPVLRLEGVERRGLVG